MGLWRCRLLHRATPRPIANCRALPRPPVRASSGRARRPRKVSRGGDRAPHASPRLALRLRCCRAPRTCSRVRAASSTRPSSRASTCASFSSCSTRLSISPDLHMDHSSPVSKDLPPRPCVLASSRQVDRIAYDDGGQMGGGGGISSLEAEVLLPVESAVCPRRGPAPSAQLVAPKAQLAAAGTGVHRLQFRSWRCPEDLASGRPRARGFFLPLCTTRCSRCAGSCAASRSSWPRSPPRRTSSHTWRAASTSSSPSRRRSTNSSAGRSDPRLAEHQELGRSPSLVCDDAPARRPLPQAAVNKQWL